jgi:transcriptional regulator with XRE-family HTH domain
MRRTDDKKVAKAFGGLLKELRLEAGLTQEGLAHDAAVERTYISLIEREQRQPSLRIFLALCKALNIAPSDAVRMLEERLKRGSR